VDKLEKENTTNQPFIIKMGKKYLEKELCLITQTE
jgi:hypothetical protein